MKSGFWRGLIFLFVAFYAAESFAIEEDKLSQMCFSETLVNVAGRPYSEIRFRDNHAFYVSQSLDQNSMFASVAGCFTEENTPAPARILAPAKEKCLTGAQFNSLLRNCENRQQIVTFMLNHADRIARLISEGPKSLLKPSSPMSAGVDF